MPPDAVHSRNAGPPAEVPTLVNVGDAPGELFGLIVVFFSVSAI